MKLAALGLCLALLAGCENSNIYGDCIGFGSDGDPTVVYETSFRNAIISIFFIETLFVPVVWVTTDAKCPVRKK
jgi:hypothetical protein